MSNKPKTEYETRLHLLSLARTMGCDIQFKQICKRYDDLLKRCTNQKEYKDISIMANAEVHNLFNFRNPLIVNGQEIIPADPDFKGE